MTRGKDEKAVRTIGRLEAVEIHRAVLDFLKDHGLLAALCHDAKPDTEQVVLSRLTTTRQPVLIGKLAQVVGVADGAITQARMRINRYLAEFCAAREPLAALCVVIQIPGGGNSPRTRFGYYLAFHDTEGQRILTVQEARELSERMRFGRIESFLKNKLKKEASDSLSEKLVGRDDYQPLEVEIGVFDGKQTVRAMVGFDRVAETQGCQRVWRSFELVSLLDLKGQYVLVSETGTGKTTFLRYLQLRILEKGRRLPICLHAAEMEHWTYNGVTALLKHIADHLELECEREAIVSYLKRNADRIFLQVDGLDQIAGVGTAYERFVKHLIGVSKEGGISLLIASRPTAVVCLEASRDVSFFRLQPLSRRMQRTYFGEHYDRSRRLYKQSQDLMGVPMLAYMVRSLVEEGRDHHIVNRAALYRAFIDYIFDEREPPYSNVSISDRQIAREFLQKMSYEALSRAEPYIQRIPLSFCCSYMPYKGMTIDRLLTLGLVTLVVDRSKGTHKVLYFAHESFQEYFAAEELAGRPDCMEVALGRVFCRAWKHVLIMLGGVLRRPGPYIAALLYANRDDVLCRPLFLAIQAAGEVGWERLPRELAGALSEQVARVSIRESLAFLSSEALPLTLEIPKGVETLLARAESWPLQGRLFIISKLHEAGSKMATVALIQMLQDPDPCVAGCAAETLGEIGSHTAVPALIQALRVEDSRIRWAAVAALGAIGSHAAVPALTEILENSQENVEVRCISAGAEVVKPNETVPFQN